MDYILCLVLMSIFLISIIVQIWGIKKQSKDSGMRTYAIYSLYKELKRHNELMAGEQSEGNNQ